jgi:hypothetical protein
MTKRRCLKKRGGQKRRRSRGKNTRGSGRRAKRKRKVDFETEDKKINIILFPSYFHRSDLLLPNLSVSISA